MTASIAECEIRTGSSNLSETGSSLNDSESEDESFIELDADSILSYLDDDNLLFDVENGELELDGIKFEAILDFDDESENEEEDEPEIKPRTRATSFRKPPSSEPIVEDKTVKNAVEPVSTGSRSVPKRRGRPPGPSRSKNGVQKMKFKKPKARETKVKNGATIEADEELSKSLSNIDINAHPEVKACLIETMKDVIMVYNRTKKEGFLPVNIKKTSNVAGEIGITASSGKGFNVIGILSEVTGMKKVTIARISDKKKPVTPKNSIGPGGQLVRICDGKNQSNQLINIQQIPQSIQIIQQNCVINGQNLVNILPSSIISSSQIRPAQNIILPVGSSSSGTGGKSRRKVEGTIRAKDRSKSKAQKTKTAPTEKEPKKEPTPKPKLNLKELIKEIDEKNRKQVTQNTGLRIKLVPKNPNKSSNFDPTKPKVIKLPTLTPEEKEKLLKKSELKVSESSSKVLLKVDSPKIDRIRENKKRESEKEEKSDNLKKVTIEKVTEEKVKVETPKPTTKVTTSLLPTSSSTAVKNVATKPVTKPSTTSSVTKMVPVSSPKTKPSTKMTQSQVKSVTNVVPVSQSMPTVQTVLTKLPIQTMKPVQTAVPVQTRLQPVPKKLSVNTKPVHKPGPQKKAVQSPVQLPIHPIHLPQTKTVQLTTSQPGGLTPNLTVSLASPLVSTAASTQIKIPQMAKISIQSQSNVAKTSVTKSVTKAVPTVVTSQSSQSTNGTRPVKHHVTQSKSRPIAAAKTQSQQSILPVVTSPVMTTHVVNHHVVNHVAPPTPLIIKNKVKPQVHLSQNVQTVHHRADPLPLNEQKPTERKKSVAEIVAESPSIVTMTPPPTPKTPPTHSMTLSSPSRTTKIDTTKFIAPQSPNKVPIQPVKTGSNQFKIKRTPTPPCSPGGQKTIEPKRTISNTTNHVTNTIRNNKIKIIDNNTIPVLPQGCQLLPIFQVVTASNQIAQPITISGSNSTSSIFTIPSTNIFTIQNTLKATDKLVPVTVPKTVQPKVEIKTIPKPSPTPPPTSVSVTGSTVTASEVTEMVTIKKEVPILEKPAVSGNNDAKIELKIGVGKDGHFDQSPTTDRLIKLDKSPIIDHIRKASFAKNVKNEKISKLEKIEKNVIKVEETNENENKNGQCDQEEKVEEVKKVKEEVNEVIRPRSNSKMAGLLLSPVGCGRKRKRCYTFSQVHAEEVSANNDPIPDSEGLEKILNLKEFLEKSTDPIFNEIPTPVIVNPVKDLVGCSTDFLTDCFPDNQFEVSLIDIPEMDPTSMIDTNKSLLLFNSNFPVPSGNPNNNNNNPECETEDNEMEDEDFMKDAFIDLMEEDKAFIEQEFKESSSQKIKREFSLVEHEFKEEIKMEIETWGHRYSESSAGSSAASGDEEMIVSRKRTLSIRSDIEEMDEDMGVGEEDELRVVPLVAIEEGPDYVDFIKMSKSDPNHPKVKITKDLQMEWSQELAKVSKTKIYESDYRRFDSDPGYKTQSEMTEELNVDELETPPYTPPYSTDDELEWDMEREDEIRQELYESMELGPDSRRSMSPTSRRQLNNVAIEPFGLGSPTPIDLPIFQKRRKHSSQNLLNRALVLEGNEKEENSNSIYFFCRDMCPNIRSVQKLQVTTNVKNGDKCGATTSTSGCDNKSNNKKCGKYLVVFNQSEDRNNFMKKCKTSKYKIQPFQNDHQRFISSS